jgi:hypothetical protein
VRRAGAMSKKLQMFTRVWSKRERTRRKFSTL